MTDKFYYLVAMLTARPESTERNERGATATEYALLVTGIALVLLVGVKVFGDALSAFFTALPTKVGIN